MKNPFKSKDGEKQSLIRLAVIAGRTSLIGSLFLALWLIKTNQEPKYPRVYFMIVLVGCFLWLAGSIAARRRNRLVPDKPVIEPFLGMPALILIVIVVVLLLGLCVTSVAKPVIYLYPEQQEDVLVKLDYIGKITAEYPAMDPALGGWKVTAFPDGHLVDTRDGRQYSYLFWEGDGRADWDWSTGFVVKGSDTRQFLQDTLPKLGLTPREYNEFIVYWYPKMQGNRYNLIHFAGREYTNMAPLTITPTPDTVIRVFMVWKPLAAPISLPEQPLPQVERKGFTVVEWGGSEER